MKVTMRCEVCEYVVFETNYPDNNPAMVAMGKAALKQSATCSKCGGQAKATCSANANADSPTAEPSWIALLFMIAVLAGIYYFILR